MFKNLLVPPEDATDDQLKESGFIEQESVEFEFRSGLKVKGILVEKIRRQGKLILLRFTECEVSYQGKVFYQPSWGIYDMAIGSRIVSCYSGPADPVAFGLNYVVPVEKTHKLQHTEKARHLFSLYQKVRDIRENNDLLNNLTEVWNELKTNHPDDWLCALEILELCGKDKKNLLYKEIKQFLDVRKSENENLEKLIRDGYAAMKDDYLNDRSHQGTGSGIKSIGWRVT